MCVCVSSYYFRAHHKVICPTPTHPTHIISHMCERHINTRVQSDINTKPSCIVDSPAQPRQPRAAQRSPEQPKAAQTRSKQPRAAQNSQ